MPQSNGLVQITSTWIESSGNTTLVLPNPGADLQLWVSASIDASLFGKGYRFDINWQIINVGNLSVVTNNWLSQCRGQSYPNLLWSPGGGDYSWFCDNQAQNFNVQSGQGGNAESGNGMYLLRVYMFVDTALYAGSFFESFGTTQWALSDDLAFWCE